MHMGNSVKSPGRLTLTKVHPHACGELRCRYGPMSRWPGSSPRLWGTLHKACHKECRIRFIPTPVGNSPLSLLVSSYLTVHPHACGELVLLYLLRLNQGGSSPRLWGTLLCRGSQMPCWRFIPTPVGNSRGICLMVEDEKVHPHACGELRVYVQRIQARNGSSPRLWGTPQ